MSTAPVTPDVRQITMPSQPLRRSRGMARGPHAASCSHPVTAVAAPSVEVVRPAPAVEVAPDTLARRGALAVARMLERFAMAPSPLEDAWRLAAARGERADRHRDRRFAELPLV